MAKQTIELDVPDGWEAVGYRFPSAGNFYLEGSSVKQSRPGVSVTPQAVILRKIEPVRESRWGWCCCVHTSLESAKLSGACTGNVIVRLDLENGTPVSVTLEPAGGGES